MACPLIQVSLEPSPLASETGITVTGFASTAGDVTSRASVFVGVGTGDEGAACLDAIREAVRASR